MAPLSAKSVPVPTRRNRMRGMMIWKSRSALALPEPSTYCDSALAAIGMTARAAVASKVLVSKRMVDVLRLEKLRISVGRVLAHDLARSEEHTSELQSLMRISYA